MPPHPKFVRFLPPKRCILHLWIVLSLRCFAYTNRFTNIRNCPFCNFGLTEHLHNYTKSKMSPALAQLEPLFLCDIVGIPQVT